MKYRICMPFNDMLFVYRKSLDLFWEDCLQSDKFAEDLEFKNIAEAQKVLIFLDYDRLCREFGDLKPVQARPYIEITAKDGTIQKIFRESVFDNPGIVQALNEFHRSILRAQHQLAILSQELLAVNPNTPISGFLAGISFTLGIIFGSVQNHFDTK